MKRLGSLKSPQIQAKIPKIENDQVVCDNGGSLEKLESPQILANVPRIENDQVVNDTNEEKLDGNSKINEIFMKKIDNLVNKLIHVVWDQILGRYFGMILQYFGTKICYDFSQFFL